MTKIPVNRGQLSMIEATVLANKTRMIEMLFSSIEEPTEKDPQYSIRLYGPQRGSRKFMAAQELDIFDAYNHGYFTTGSYEDYKNLFREYWGSAKILKSFSVFIYSIAYNYELDNKQQIASLLPHAIRWFEKRVIWTVWQGKQKELLFGAELQKALPKGFSIYKPTADEDRTYMLDYWIMQGDKVALGVSVKGESYMNTLHREGSWANTKEFKETEGHNKFTDDTGAQVFTAISSYSDIELLKDQVKQTVYFLKFGEDRPTYEVVKTKAIYGSEFEELEF